MRWQARYETEKELVGLLRDYDAAYVSYKTYTDKTSNMYEKPGSSSIAFVFEGRTVLTDANIRLASVAYNTANGGEYFVSISFDSVGTAIFAELTSNHFGGVIEIVQTLDGSSTVISSPTISSAITNGKADIYGNFTKETADDFCLHIWSSCAERNVKQAAIAYNEKRAASASRYAMPDYLPASLSSEPEYSDVSACLQKAENLGFTA